MICRRKVYTWKIYKHVKSAQAKSENVRSTDIGSKLKIAKCENLNSEDVRSENENVKMCNFSFFF